MNATTPDPVSGVWRQATQQYDVMLHTAMTEAEQKSVETHQISKSYPHVWAVGCLVWRSIGTKLSAEAIMTLFHNAWLNNVITRSENKYNRHLFSC